MNMEVLRDHLQDSVDEIKSSVVARMEEFERRQDQLEAALRRPLVGDSTDRGPKSPQYKAFETFLRRGADALSEIERKAALSIAPDTAGGYLVAPEFDREIVKNLILVSPIRQVATVKPMSGTSILLPARTGAPTGYWVSEQGTRMQTAMVYGQLEIPCNEMAVFVDISNQLLEDSAFDMQAEISMDLALEFQALEGAAFVVGSGVGQPEGLLTNAGIATAYSGSAATIADANGQANGLIDAFYGLKPFYRGRATWLMNGTTLAACRELKDNQNRYIWQPSLAAGQPETILGRPVLEVPDMPDQAAGATPIMVGDIASTYRIYDRTAMSILRDPYTMATSGIIRFHARRRVAGQVVLPEAAVKIECAA